MILYQVMAKAVKNDEIVSYTLLEIGNTNGNISEYPSILVVDTEEFGEMVKAGQIRRCTFIGEGPVGINGFSLDKIVTIDK